jgi:hypothetical protein
MAETNGHGRRQYLLFVPSPTGYTLREIDGDPPRVGHEFDYDGRTLVVNKVGASPLPGDLRACAFSIGKH